MLHTTARLSALVAVTIVFLAAFGGGLYAHASLFDEESGDVQFSANVTPTPPPTPELTPGQAQAGGPLGPVALDAESGTPAAPTGTPTDAATANGTATTTATETVTATATETATHTATETATPTATAVPTPTATVTEASTATAVSTSTATATLAGGDQTSTPPDPTPDAPPTGA